MLKQPLYQPKSMEEQVVLLCAATSKKFLRVPVQDTNRVVLEFWDWFQEKYPNIVASIRDTGNLGGEEQHTILFGAEEYLAVKGYGES
jgi:F-type H+-transporting ATPase subunit alpha